MQVCSGWMALTTVKVKLNAVLLKSCGKHDRHFTHADATCSDTKFTGPKMFTVQHVYSMCTHWLLMPPVFLLFLCTQTRTYTHTHRQFKLMQLNSLLKLQLAIFISNVILFKLSYYPFSLKP